MNYKECSLFGRAKSEEASKQDSELQGVAEKHRAI